ncbi:MAG: Xaa-Pro peptidase family protein [Acidiferrobacterales bacterium]|nr:Xaa-Pro peptidase family protein [Acidiferrobacterales bacterium]
MATFFSEAEFQERRDRTAERLRLDELDSILIFRQESMYYLTGYDTFGYCFFQCLYLDVSGRYALLTRLPDLRQAQITSTISDIRVWVDQAGHNPVDDLIAMLDDFSCRGKRLGIELHAYGLTAQLWGRIEPALSDYCSLVDASDLVSALRVIKSPAEISYVERAAALADDALDAAIQTTHPGAFEGDILAAMHAAIYRGGGDDPANEFIIGSGENALLCRYHTGRRTLSDDDQLTLEFAGVYRHYHACLMRTILVGKPDPRQKKMSAACEHAISACKDVLVPGASVGEVFDTHARIMDDHGFRNMRMNACGYSLGTTYAPTWMDWPMFYTGNPVTVEPNMVYFLHMILFDSDNNLAMTLGETVHVTQEGPRTLSRHGTELICC